MIPDSAPPDFCSAIIVAAGNSRRMGFDKLACLLAGKPVLERTLDAFLATACIDAIVVVCPDDRWQLFGPAIFEQPVSRVDGGADRQNSVARGLAAMPPETQWVAVHDGARPLIHPDEISRCLAEAKIHRAAALARRAAETLKLADAENFSTSSVSRENLWFMETPQIFSADLLRNAYEKVIADGLPITDEVSALEAIGARVKFVESRHPNLKITTPADLALAAALFR